MPVTGGDTMWSHQYLAYELLSEPEPARDLLDGLSAVHVAAQVGTERSEEHPAVCLHPETGRKSLFVNRTSTSHFNSTERSSCTADAAYMPPWRRSIARPLRCGIA